MVLLLMMLSEDFEFKETTFCPLLLNRLTLWVLYLRNKHCIDRLTSSLLLPPQRHYNHRLTYLLQINNQTSATAPLIRKDRND